MSLLIKNGEIVTSSERYVADIFCEGETITRIDRDIVGPPGLRSSTRAESMSFQASSIRIPTSICRSWNVLKGHLRDRKQSGAGGRYNDYF